MPLNQSIKTIGILCPKWAVVTHSDILPLATLPFMPGVSWLSIDKIHQYIC